MRQIHHSSPYLRSVVATCVITLSACSTGAKDDSAARGVNDSTALLARSDSTDSTRAPGLHSDSGQGSPRGGDVTGTVLPGVVSDTILANIIAVVDRGEVETGQLATTKARSAEAKAYARDMVAAHSRDLTAIRRVMRTSGIAMADSTISDAQLNASGDPVMRLMQQQRETMEALRLASRERFDLAYADAMVAGHQEVLQILSQNAGAASADPLKAHLAAAEKMVSEHLTRAKQLQRSFAAKAAATTGQ